MSRTDLKRGRAPPNTYDVANASSNARRNRNPPNTRPLRLRCCGCATNMFSVRVASLRIASGAASAGSSIAARASRAAASTKAAFAAARASLAAPRSAAAREARVVSFSAAFFRATRSPVDANSARLASHSGTRGFTAALLLVTASRATKVKSADSEGPERFAYAFLFFSFFVFFVSARASSHAGASGCSAGHASIRMTMELRPTHATAPERMTSSSSFSARISRTRSTEAVTSNCGRVFRSASSQWEKAMFPASESRSSRTRPTRTAFHGLRYASIRFSSAEKEYRMDVRVGGLGTSASCARVAAASDTPAAFACASLSCHSFDVMAVRSRATAYPRVEHTGQARRSRAARVTARSDARIVTLGPNVQPRFGVWDATLGCPLTRARLRAASSNFFTRAASRVREVSYRRSRRIRSSPPPDLPPRPRSERRAFLRFGARRRLIDGVARRNVPRIIAHHRRGEEPREPRER